MLAVSLVQMISRCDGGWFPPAHPHVIAHLAETARQLLGSELPEDYLALLAVSDGAMADGLLIYPSSRHHTASGEVPGLVEINLSRRAYRSGLDDFVMLGEYDDDFVVYRSDHSRFAHVDRLSLTCYTWEPCLLDLVCKLLRCTA
jgi:hypothetical protein